MIDFMELRRETTRFLRDAQYLPTEAKVGVRPGILRLGRVLPLTPKVLRNLKDLLCDFENAQ